MPKIDYSKMVIYKILSKDNNIKYIYIGSTTDFTKRKWFHKKNSELYLSRMQIALFKTLEKCANIYDECNNDSTLKIQNGVTAENKLYSMINANGGWKNWNIEILEKYSCKCHTDVIEREKEWYAKLCSEKVSPESELKCKYCKKKSSRKDNLTRHELKCKIKSKTRIELEELSIKKELHDRPINNTNNNNTIINNYINRPPDIIPLGKENLVEFFTKDEQVKILKKMFGCFIYLVEYVHFSGKFPQFANISITNLKSNIAYLYDESYNQFNACDQTRLITELITERLQDIENFLENVKGELTEKEILKIKQLISEIEDQQEKYKTYAKNIKMMMYNNRNMVNVKIIPMKHSCLIDPEIDTHIIPVLENCE